MRVADQAVAHAARHIGERDAVFAAAILEREAGDAARGQATNADIVAAIARAERRQDLVIRAAPGMARGAVGYTTREAIATEQRMLALEATGRTLFPAERARTLVLDPTRAGRQQLTDAIRAELRRDGTLGDRAMVASVLEACDLSDAQRTRAANYRPGSIVLFRRDDDAAGLHRDTGYQVAHADPATNTLRLLAPDGQAIDWNLANAAHAEAYVEVAQEFRTGDRIQFTRNNHPAKRINGRTATVVAIDPDEGLLVVAARDGRRQKLAMDNVLDRLVRPGWVQTVHSAQGATADRVIAHLDSTRANVDARTAYVAVSRAKTYAAIYTDDRAALIDAIDNRDGAKVGAIDETLARAKVAAIASPAPVRAAGIAIG